MAADASTPQPEPAPGDAETPGPAAATVSRAAPPKCPTRTRLYVAGHVVDEGFPAEGIGARLQAEPSAVVWLDLFDPDEADLQIVVEEFGLHPLAVEDAVHDHQRPKLDRYRTHLFTNMYAAAVEPRDASVTTTELSAFITERALITVRKGEFDVDALVAHWDLNSELAEFGVGFLTYGLLDAVVDGQYAAIEALDDAIDELEDNLFAPRAGFDLRRRGFELRKALGELRRVVAPMQEVIGRVTRNDTHLLDEHLVPYFHDVADHVLRATEQLDGGTARVANILDTNLNEQTNQLNEVTKKLAAWAAIIAVPTAVTGWYGQNIPYPGFGHHVGFWASTIVIIGLAGGLYVLLRRRNWL